MVAFYGKDSLQHTLGWQPKRPSCFLSHLSTISSQQLSSFLLKETSLYTSSSSDVAGFNVQWEEKKQSPQMKRSSSLGFYNTTWYRANNTCKPSFAWSTVTLTRLITFSLLWCQNILCATLYQHRFYGKRYAFQNFKYSN